MKEAKFKNNGYEELTYEELFYMTNTTPNKTFLETNDHKIIPRKIPNEYIEEISYFAPIYDNLLYCICMEVPFTYEKRQIYRRFYFNPSMRLFATMERYNEQQIGEMLGEKDNLDKNEYRKIKEIIYYIKQSPYYIKRKRLSNILIPKKIKKLVFKGNAMEAVVPSKYTNDYYKVLYKQPIFFDGKSININPHIQATCNCGYQIHSNIKYEFYNILTSCSHIDFMNQSLEYPKENCDEYRIENNDKIVNIFNPFKNLDNPINYSIELRKILRNGLYNYIVPQEYIRNYYNDSNSYHRKNGFTWFRCELDLYLLSFNEIYSNEFINLLNNNINVELSNLITTNFLGDYVDDNIIEITAEHQFNINKNRLEHLIEGNWKKIYHYAYDICDKQYYPLDDSQFRHNSKTFSHEFIDNSINPMKFEIKHMLKMRKQIIGFKNPIQVSVLKNGIRLFIYPYKNKKER